jgi:hypothetical protein
VHGRDFGAVWKQKRALLFKKEAKNFYLPWAMALRNASRNQSFFASFCSQKEVLPLLFVS